MKNLLIPAIPLLLSMSGPASAALLWTTSFTGTDGTTRNLVNTTTDVAFTDVLTADYANLTFQDTSFTGTVFHHSGNLAGGDHFSPRTNVDNPGAASPQNGGWWQSEFRYAGGSQRISLENVVFDVVWTNSSGNRQAGDVIVRDITFSAEYSLNAGTTWNPIAAAQTYNLTVNPGTALQQYQNKTYTFASPLAVDHAAQDLWLRVRAENANATAGAYVNIRDISFSGTVVPEPGTTLLGSIGGLILLRRKRRMHHN
ncbi:MAG: PEP-CTERM sorting domain-containing protein [Luteolibacter sp.]|jgi:hypothetical protein|nr:PEP-CTERM sorting domain-containing protein [Luteolibacter sp.]